MVPRPDGPDQRSGAAGPRRRRAGPDPARARQAARLLRLPDRAAAPDGRVGRARGAARPGHPPGLQDRGHLRGRVRRQDAVPLQLLRRGVRGRAARAPGRHHPRLGAQPDRSGCRVRLLVRARELLPAGGRLRHGHGQLQPRDRLDRLRHEQPPLLRAADPRGRPRGHPRREQGRADRRRHRPARWADAPRPGEGAQGRGRPDRRHLARGHRPRGGPGPLRPCPPRGRAQRAQARDGLQRGRGRGDRPRDRLPGPRAALLRPRWPRHGDRLRRRDPQRVRHPGGDRLAGAPDPRRPLPRRRDRDRRRRDLRRHGHVPRRDHGAHRGGRDPLR